MDCGYRQYDIFVPTFALAAVFAQMIGDIAGVNLEHSVAESNTQRNMLLIVFSVSLVVVGFLTWFQVLKRLREIHNDFKKVLQVFPPTFVLSSFLLKTYLQKNSKQFLLITE